MFCFEEPPPGYAVLWSVAPVGHALVEVHALSFRSWLSTDASTKAQSCPVAHREHAASSRINSHIGFGVHQCVRPCVPIKIFVVEFLSNFSSESNESTPRSCSLMVVRVQTNSMQINIFFLFDFGCLRCRFIEETHVDRIHLGGADRIEFASIWSKTEAPGKHFIWRRGKFE